MPFISYQTHGIIRILFIIKLKRNSTTPLIKKLTSPKKRKNNGSESILNIGRIMVLRIHSMIPPVK